jgi:protein-S-isoprenylcysteine O-methyltransferase
MVLAVILTVGWFTAFALSSVARFSFGGVAVVRAGLLVMLVGQLLRWWSMATLGRLFTVNVAIRADHRVVESGPYRYIRHPSYTAILLVHLGAALCLGNALSLFALLVPLTIGLLNRIRIEEDVLSSNFGESYREYMKRTKRLIPVIY